MLLRDWAWIKRVSMWNSSPVPKTGQILKESSIYQMVIKKRMGLVCIDKMTIVALKVPSYKANERGVWHPESKNRSTVKARFRHPSSGHGMSSVYTILKIHDPGIQYEPWTIGS